LAKKEEHDGKKWVKTVTDFMVKILSSTQFVWSVWWPTSDQYPNWYCS
jgi:hypothetical protein